MYKNIIYRNKQKSVKKYEKKLLESEVFNGIVKTNERKSMISYTSPDILITIKKHVVVFLVFNCHNHNIINQINNLYELTNKGLN